MNLGAKGNRMEGRIDVDTTECDSIVLPMKWASGFLFRKPSISQSINLSLSLSLSSSRRRKRKKKRRREKKEKKKKKKGKQNPLGLLRFEKQNVQQSSCYVDAINTGLFTSSPVWTTRQLGTSVLNGVSVHANPPQ